MGRELPAAGLDKCQCKAIETVPVTRFGSIILSSFSQVIDI